MANPEPRSSATRCVAQWLWRRWWAFLLCSAVLLVPCFWHRHIQACDLGSHLYNAWLSQAVASGSLPGLHLETKYTNVLVDLLLSGLFPHLGAQGTERVVTALCVFAFFWGSFAFTSAVSNHEAWRLVPLLAMVSYGAIFHWGFLNFYLSVGLSLFALALIATGTLLDFLWLPMLFALSASAHPLGAACLVGLGLYAALLRVNSLKLRIAITSCFLLLAAAVRWYVVRHFEVLPRDVPYYFMAGADQLIVFGRPFIVLAAMVLTLCLLFFITNRHALLCTRWADFYLVVAVAVVLAPGGLYSEAHFGMMGYLPDRASLYSCVALVALVATLRPRAWFVVSSAALSLAFFTILYHDTGYLQQRTQHLAHLLHHEHSVRVISLVPAIPGWRIHEDHSLERACIGHCYVYNNYEPSSEQFRLVADPGNRVVDVDQEALDEMSDGNYVVRPEDVPLMEAYQCGDSPSDLCVVALREGQRNGDVPNLHLQR